MLEDWGPHSRKAFFGLWSLLTILSLTPIWAFEFLPMVDLPQHLQQLLIWLDWQDPSSPYRQHLELNWRTPYILPGFLAYLWAQVFDPLVALRLLISFGVLAPPALTLLLLRETNGEAGWALLAFPIGFSFSFYWGFFNYIVASPLALLGFWLALRYSSDFKPRRALAIFFALHLIFLGHALLYGLCGLVAAGLVSLRAPSFKAMILRLLPLIATLPLVLLWLRLTHQKEAVTREATIWSIGWQRLPELLSQIVGLPPEPQALIFAALLIALPLLGGARPSRQFDRYMPLLVVSGLFLFAPFSAFGTALLYQRSAIFFLPALLMTFERRQPVSRPAIYLGAGLVATWLLFLISRFSTFDHESRDLGRVIAAMSENRRVLYLNVDRRSSADLPYPVFLHAGLWYHATKVGMVEPSFAESFLTRFRYQPEREPRLPLKFRRNPLLYDWQKNGGLLYDYFLIKSETDVAATVFRKAEWKIVLERREGLWWLYRHEPWGVPGDWVKRSPTSALVSEIRPPNFHELPLRLKR